MTILELLKQKNKDYDYIEFRISIESEDETLFFGSGENDGDEVFLHDENDSDFLNETIISYEEWSNEKQGVKNGLTIVF